VPARRTNGYDVPQHQANPACEHLFDRVRVSSPWKGGGVHSGSRNEGDLTTRVQRLRREANNYRDRYGDLDDLEPLDRIDRAIASRVARIKQLRQIADEVNAEIRGFELEIEGIEKGAEALLGDLLSRIARRFDEAWSPTPVLGFRLWATSESGIHGVHQQWREPTLRATCDATSNDAEVPHTDGRCGRLGCGIYAAKDAFRLLTEFAPALRSSFAVGLVGLSGKVVEHERGYRGEHAVVLAVVAIANMRAGFISEPSHLDTFFASRDIPVPLETFEDRPGLLAGAVDYLLEQERNQDQWT